MSRASYCKMRFKLSNRQSIKRPKHKSSMFFLLITMNLIKTSRKNTVPLNSQNTNLIRRFSRNLPIATLMTLTSSINIMKSWKNQANSSISRSTIETAMKKNQYRRYPFKRNKSLWPSNNPNHDGSNKSSKHNHNYNLSIKRLNGMISLLITSFSSLACSFKLSKYKRNNNRFMKIEILNKYTFPLPSLLWKTPSLMLN